MAQTCLVSSYSLMWKHAWRLHCVVLRHQCLVSCIQYYCIRRAQNHRHQLHSMYHKPILTRVAEMANLKLQQTLNILNLPSNFRQLVSVNVARPWTSNGGWGGEANAEVDKEQTDHNHWHWLHDNSASHAARQSEGRGGELQPLSFTSYSLSAINHACWALHSLHFISLPRLRCLTADICQHEMLILWVALASVWRYQY